MTNPTHLVELAERVQRATGPDWELDRDMCLALSYSGYVPEPLNLRIGEDGWLDYELIEDGHTVQCSDLPPDLSASIDAALGLVERLLPGSDWCIDRHDGQFFATLWRPDDLKPTANETAQTAPLAILLAALKSLSEKNDATE